MAETPPTFIPASADGVYRLADRELPRPVVTPPLCGHDVRYEVTDAGREALSLPDSTGSC